MVGISLALRQEIYIFDFLALVKKIHCKISHTAKSFHILVLLNIFLMMVHIFCELLISKAHLLNKIKTVHEVSLQG